MNGIKVVDLTASTCKNVYNRRPKGAKSIKGILLHTTEGENSYEWLRCGHGVSIHKLITREGVIIKMVAEENRAWHAGDSSWGGEPDWGDISIGYEIEHKKGGKPITDAQYEAVAQSIAYDTARFRIEDYWIRFHREVAMPRGRKSDPTDFDWARVYKRVQEIRQAWPAEWAPVECWFKANR